MSDRDTLAETATTPAGDLLGAIGVALVRHQCGYSDEQMETAAAQSCADAGCEPFDASFFGAEFAGSTAYDCTDEDGNSHHPIRDEIAGASDLANVAVEVVEALGWRPPAQVITDPNTPDTFPIRTAGFDRDGEVWVSTYAGWATVTVDLAVPLADVIADFGSLTIVYIPTCPHDSRSGADGRWRCDQCAADCGPDTYLTPTEEGE